MPFKSKIDLAYIAGIVDGEGCISVRKRKVGKKYRYTQHNITLIVVNTDKKMIDFLQRIFPAYVMTYQDKKPNCRRMWRWCIESRKAEKILKDILPYLITKKGQAKVAIELSETKKYCGAKSKIKIKEFIETVALREKLSEKIRYLKFAHI